MDFTQLPSLAFLLLSVIASIVKSNPVPQQKTYDVYSRLICETQRLWREDYLLYTQFKSARLPELFEITGVDVPNLLLTNDLTDDTRDGATEIALLKIHRDFLYSYSHIMDNVLSDETMTNSAPSFETSIENLRNYISISINQLENTLFHLGEEASDLTYVEEDKRPRFDPEVEANTYDRYKRDLYIFEQMKEHLQKAVTDFSELRNDYLEPTTTSYSCTV